MSRRKSVGNAPKTLGCGARTNHRTRRPRARGAVSGIPTPRRHIDTAREDKVSWCRRLLPEGVEVNVVYRREKRKFCKGRESVLIDDFSENVAAWESAGGTGILFRGIDDARRQLRGLGIL